MARCEWKRRTDPKIGHYKSGLTGPCATEGKRKPGTYILFLVGFLLWSTGCGAPGEPVPPSPPIPTAILDLRATQAGDGVMLNFTMPGKSVAGDKLTEIPTIEILHGDMSPSGEVDEQSFRVVDTVPGAMFASYTKKSSAHFLEPVAASEIRAHPGVLSVYRVRARVSDQKVSANSNDAVVKLFPVAAPIEGLQANLTENGIALSWSAPQQTSGGEALPSVAEYHVYRGEMDPASAEAAAQQLSRAVWKSPLVQIATTKTPEFQDHAFDYGKSYAYVVRATLSGGDATLESGDSHFVILTPRDTFAPAAPQGIVAAVLPGEAAGKTVADLSWSINTEPDLAGYRVYRSEQQGVRGMLLTQELLLTPAYRDLIMESGKHYWYSVTAVDRAGNESVASEQVGLGSSAQ